MATPDEEPRYRWYQRYAPGLVVAGGLLAVGAVMGFSLYAGEEQARAETATQVAEKGQDLAAEVTRRCDAGGDEAAGLGSLCSKATEVQQQAPAVTAENGTDGVGIARVDTSACTLTIRLTNGRSDTLDNLCGEPGRDAPPARGITGTTSDACYVTVAYTDATVQRVGPFCGAPGAQGEEGQKGDKGDAPPCLSEPAQCRGPIGPPGPAGENGSPADTQTFTLPDGRVFTCTVDPATPRTAPRYGCEQTSAATTSTTPTPLLPMPGS